MNYFISCDLWISGSWGTIHQCIADTGVLQFPHINQLSNKQLGADIRFFF